MTIYFYKVNEPYGCFSNFSPHGIAIGGENWQTVEHYYQAQKFIGTPDEKSSLIIKAVPTPEQAAALGRDCRRQLRSNWEQIKVAVMREAVRQKFFTHQDIQAILLSTSDLLIVEDSPNDYYWGCGETKTGDNHLGKILMSVRAEIKSKL
jgi:N-glycosidase YbiA